jgi:hypothetical protein
MKLKKITAVIIAIAFMLGMTAIPASASLSITKLEMRPNHGTPRYEVRVTGTFTGFREYFDTGATITLDPEFLPSAAPNSMLAPALNVSNFPNIRPVLVTEVKDVVFGAIVNGVSVRTNVTQPTITFADFGGINNILNRGTVTQFSWTATLVLEDDTRHPIQDLGFTALGAAYVNRTTMNNPAIRTSVSSAVAPNPAQNPQPNPPINPNLFCFDRNCNRVDHGNSLCQDRNCSRLDHLTGTTCPDRHCTDPAHLVGTTCPDRNCTDPTHLNADRTRNCGARTCGFRTCGQRTCGNWRIEVMPQFIPKNTNLGIPEFVRGSAFASLTVDQAAAIRSANRFDVTVSLNRNSPVNNHEIFELFTSLNGAPIRASIRGENTVTFTNVPKAYFFNTPSFNMFGGMDWEHCFRWLQIRNDNPDLLIEAIDINLGLTHPADSLPRPESSANTELILNFNSITLNAGASHRPTIRAEGFTASQLTFTMAPGHTNGNIVSIYNTGQIRAVRNGAATINVRNRAGDMAQVRVTVVNAPSRPLRGFRFLNTTGTVYQHGSYNLMSAANAEVNPSNHNDRINWYSSDTSIATVDNGRVRIVGTGEVTITAVSRSGIVATRTLNARPPSIVMEQTNATINTSGTHRIIASSRPGGTLTFRSLDENIAAVNPDTGVITGISRGTTRIEVRSNRGAVRMFTVLVR